MGPGVTDVPPNTTGMAVYAAFDVVTQVTGVTRDIGGLPLPPRQEHRRLHPLGDADGCSDLDTRQVFILVPPADIDSAG